MFVPVTISHSDCCAGGMLSPSNVSTPDDTIQYDTNEEMEIIGIPLHCLIASASCLRGYNCSKLQLNVAELQLS